MFRVQFTEEALLWATLSRTRATTNAELHRAIRALAEELADGVIRLLVTLPLHKLAPVVDQLSFAREKSGERTVRRGGAIAAR